MFILSRAILRRVEVSDARSGEFDVSGFSSAMPLSSLVMSGAASILRKICLLLQ